MIIATSHGIEDLVGWHPPKIQDSNSDELITPKNKSRTERPFLTSVPVRRLLFSDFCVKRLEMNSVPAVAGFDGLILGWKDNKDDKVRDSKCMCLYTIYKNYSVLY